jgi:hypothetical protein
VVEDREHRPHSARTASSRIPARLASKVAICPAERPRKVLHNTRLSSQVATKSLDSPYDSFHARISRVADGPAPGRAKKKSIRVGNTSRTLNVAG